MKKKKNTFTLSVSLVLLIIITLFSAFYIFIAPNTNLPDDKTEYLYISDEATFETITNQLFENKALKSIFTFTLAAKIYGYKDIKPGRYEISAGMNNLKLIHKLKNRLQSPLKLTFNNIRTKEQLAERLSKQIMADSLSIIQHLNDSAFLASYQFSPTTSVALFIPDTYEVFWDMDAQELFERMKREYDSFWTESRRDQAAAIPLTPIEVSTLASIVEEETNKSYERPTVAGLYINRLKKNILLQADPTARFAYGDFTIQRITAVQLQTNSPYNTYKNKGLPPGPIRLASKSAIDAVLNYDKHNYIFMCAKETFNGEHNFASTYEQHKVNAKKYQKALNDRKIFK